MPAHRSYSRRRALSLSVVLLIFTLGCLCLPAGFLPTPTPIPPEPGTPIIPAIPSPTEPGRTPSAPTFPPIPTPSPTKANLLNAEGPWLLIETDQGLWAANPDGTGLNQITQVDYWRGDLRFAIQPSGNHLAAVQPAYDPSNNLVQLMLLEYALPYRSSLIAEIGHGAGDPSNGVIDPFSEVVKAITGTQSFAWSPDGKKLAFVGAIVGPSADLYIYDETTLKITRVSSDPDQDFAPSWSPDGKHILYMEAKGFGTGAGYSMAAVWVADGDGTNATRLYTTDSSGEEMRGWLDKTTAVLDTWNVVCGPGNLRLYDVTTRQETILQKDCITSAAADGLRGLAMYSDSTGLYRVSFDNKTPVKVDDRPNAQIKAWGPDDQLFTVRYEDASLATFLRSDFDHQLSPITAPPDSSMLPFDQTDVAIYGAIWGWTSRIPAQPGAWITGPGMEFGQIFDRPARFPSWSPDNNLFFFAPLEGGYDLYMTTFASYYSDLHVVNHLDADIIGVAWARVK